MPLCIVPFYVSVFFWLGTDYCALMVKTNSIFELILDIDFMTFSFT